MSRALAQALVDKCANSQTVREVSQTVADALNPSSGHPVSGSDELLVIAGSSYFQKGADFMVVNQFAPLTNQVGGGGNYEIKNSSTGVVIASELPSEASDSHDIFGIDFMREPASGSLVLNAYGFSSAGTAAATYYFEHSIAGVTGSPNVWYVGEWADKDADLKPDADEFTIIASGN